MPLHQLPSINIAPGTTGTTSLKDLPTFLQGRLPHVRKFMFDVTMTPTFTTAPSIYGTNNVFTACDFWDGGINRFVGGFNTMRLFERLHNGHNRLPDPDTDTASTNPRYFRRSLWVGPPNFVNADSDFVFPVAGLASGELRWSQGALTDISADTTALTGTVRIYADLDLLDEVRIPPVYTFVRYNANASDYPLPGRALYETICLLRSAAWANFGAGEVGNVRLDLGRGDIVNSIAASALTAAYNDDWAVGDFGALQGQPAGVYDDNPKMVNHGTPTALGPVTNEAQLLVWSRPRQKITKLNLAEASARLQWDGTMTGGSPIMVGRFLPQSPTVVGSLATRVLTTIGRSVKGVNVKTASKKPYNGPYVEFMPYDITV